MQTCNMNGIDGTERTHTVVVRNTGDNLKEDASGMLARMGEQPAQPRKLPNVGTPEASAPVPVYFQGKDESRATSPSALPGIGVGAAGVTGGVMGLTGVAGLAGTKEVNGTPTDASATADASPACCATAATPPEADAGKAPANAGNADGGSHQPVKHYLHESQRGSALEQFGTADVKEAARMIGKMGQRDLQAKFKLVYGQPTHSNNNEWLRRKLCEAIGALPIKPPNRNRGRRNGGTKKARSKQRHPVAMAEALSVKRVRVPSQKMRECIREGHVPPFSERDNSSDNGSIGTGIHIRLSKDGVYRSRSLPSKSAASRASRAVTSTSHFTTAMNNGSSEDDAYPYLDPYEQSVLPAYNSLPIVFGHSNSTTDLTELVNRVDKEEERQRQEMEQRQREEMEQRQRMQQMQQGLLMEAGSPEEAPMSGWPMDTEEVLLLDIDSAPFNAALLEAQGLL